MRVRKIAGELAQNYAAKHEAFIEQQWQQVWVIMLCQASWFDRSALIAQISKVCCRLMPAAT